MTVVSRNPFAFVLAFVLAAFGLAACGDKPTAPPPGAEEASLQLTLRGFAGQPALVASNAGAGMRYSGTRVALRLESLGDGTVLVERDVPGEAFTLGVNAGAVTAFATLPVPPGTGTYAVTGQIFNALGEQLYAFDGAQAVFNGTGTVAIADAPVEYLGPGRDVAAVSVLPDAVELEVFRFTNILCTGARPDGSQTNDFPKLFFVEHPNVATVNPVTGVLSAHAPGTTTVQCRIAFGSLAESRIDVRVVDRTPTPPVSLTLEAPAPLAAGEPYVVPIGTRIPIRVRARDAQGDFAAGAPVDFVLLIGSGGSVEPATVVTGNDGIAEAIFTVGPLLHVVRPIVSGTTITANTVNRYGN